MMRRIADLDVRGQTIKIVLLDEPEVETDPTLLVFRGDEEEAVATIHLDPGAKCGPDYGTYAPDHVVVRPVEGGI